MEDEALNQISRTGDDFTGYFAKTDLDRAQGQGPVKKRAQRSLISLGQGVFVRNYGARGFIRTLVLSAVKLNSHAHPGP